MSDAAWRFGFDLNGPHGPILHLRRDGPEYVLLEVASPDYMSLSDSERNKEERRLLQEAVNTLQRKIDDDFPV